MKKEFWYYMEMVQNKTKEATNIDVLNALSTKLEEIFEVGGSDDRVQGTASWETINYDELLKEIKINGKTYYSFEEKDIPVITHSGWIRTKQYLLVRNPKYKNKSDLQETLRQYKKYLDENIEENKSSYIK